MLIDTLFYPVDVHNRIIYDDPRDTEHACSTTLPGCIGVTGDRLNTWEIYKTFVACVLTHNAHVI